MENSIGSVVTEILGYIQNTLILDMGVIQNTILSNFDIAALLMNEIVIMICSYLILFFCCKFCLFIDQIENKVNNFLQFCCIT